MKENDTITAISTPYGSGGIGIIRISGERAFDIAEKVFKSSRNTRLKQIKSHTISYGHIIDPKDKSLIDEVLLTKMDKPNTFTKENIIEINCHGGIVVLRRVLELVMKEGARLAEPGEFTKRAFLNGRIDLAQGEAVIDLINAKTSRSSRIALEQLKGKLSVKIKEIRDMLIGLIAHIEATLDFPEEDIDEIAEAEIYHNLRKIKDELITLLSGFKKGKIIKEGIKAVIIGRPNVGKSSLLNKFAGYDRAIVTDIPGTTRDTVEEYISIKGIPVRILDTAGIRETEDEIEKIGVKRTMDSIKTADLVIMMVDATLGFTSKDAKILEEITDISGKEPIILLNKIDLVETDKIKGIEEKNIIKTSMKDGRGIAKLEEKISDLFIGGALDTDSETLITNLRHKNLIENTLNSINDAMFAQKSAMPPDCITIDIRDAAQYLGEITGESINDEILDQIFARFCIGK